MKKNKSKILPIFFVIFGMILVIISMIRLYSISQKEESKPSGEQKAIQIILEHDTSLKEKDLKFVEITEKEEYKILNQKSSNSYQKMYFMVNLKTKEYYLSTATRRGTKSE